MALEGVYIPLVTPFKNGSIDLVSYKKMIQHYMTKGIAGFIPLATTGESPTIEEDEYFAIVDATFDIVGDKLPIYFGASGNDTAKVIKLVHKLEKHGAKGILSSGPYYNRPDQRGIFEHFSKIAESSSLDIIIYNIPYRTARNIENDTIRRLAEIRNIIGIKDSCGDIKQTSELLIDPPSDFSILTGEDALFFSTLALGGKGGILASAHISTDVFVSVYNNMKDNNHSSALEKWKPLSRIIPLLFGEPNPAPIKYCLAKLNLIASSETRLPLMEITDELKKALDKALK
ncbi:MAG TPA: 4-hydroxy-tetrahydrodipicolinate synthase [Spirochaetota bacterium]|nr:4-hydroxy-tetrahydrodipicolinate synthase [Spirochaetota bacterium]